MVKTKQLPSMMRLGNFVATMLLRAGIQPGNMTLLTVRGRKSGQPRTTPVAVVEYDNQRYLIAAFGLTQWVRNLRVAGRATLTCGRRSEGIDAIELPPAEAAIILKYSLSRAPGFVRRHFDVTVNAPQADLERETLRHPVFWLQPAGIPGNPHIHPAITTETLAK